MFARATSFRADISNWDVSSVTNMDYMFHEAKSFNLNLCGTAWVHSKASKVGMFGDSSGSISRRVCTRQSMNVVPTRRRASRRPVPDRELIARTSITTAVSSPAIGSLIAHTMTCPKCGMFKKSGRASCCAPGGAWFKNCGGASNRNVDHKWSEGAKACKPATATTTISACSKCVPIKKSGKTSCCGRGGSWFRNCGSVGNTRLDHTWYEGIQVCQTWAESKIAFGRQSNAAQQLNSPNGAGVVNFKTNTTADKIFTFTPVNTSTATSYSTSTAYSAGTASSKAIAAAANAIIYSPVDMSTPTPTIPPVNTSSRISMTNTSTNMLTTAPVHSIVLPTTTATATTTATVTTTTALFTLTAKEATIATDWISQDSFVEGIIFVCVILLLLIILTLTGYFFCTQRLYCHKRISHGASQPDRDSISKDVKLY